MKEAVIPILIDAMVSRFSRESDRVVHDVSHMLKVWAFAKQIADKWEGGFLKMCSAGLDIVETSVDPVHLLPGQTRATVLRCKLTEVSIVDIGSNDDALQLTNSGQLLTLASGEACEALPLLELNKPETKDNANGEQPAASINNNKITMKK